MKNHNRSLFVIVSLLLAFSMLMAGCTTPEAEVAETEAAEETTGGEETAVEEPAAAEPVKIGVSIADQSNVFYVDILAGMESAMKEGDQLIVMDAAFDAAKQITDIEDMIQQGVDVMLVDPVDSKAIQPALEACQAAGIPVIAYNSPVDDSTMVVSTVASDNYMAGELIGEALAQEMGGEGTVAMLTYNVAQVCLDRANGFISAISNYDGIEIVESQEIQPGVDTALPVMENILQAYPDLTGVFALNDPSAIGAAAAIESAGLLDQIAIVGVDGSDDGKVAICEGRMLASAAQHPVDIGSISVETAYAVIAGETVEADIKVPVELVNADNCAQ